VIAVFYTDKLHLAWLALALALLALMIVLQKLRVWSVAVYIVIGVVLWFALLQSGVHATLAGVAIGLITPATALLKEDVARKYARKALADQHPPARRAEPPAFPDRRVGAGGRAVAGVVAPLLGVRRTATLRPGQRRRLPGRVRRRADLAPCRSGSSPVWWWASRSASCWRPFIAVKTGLGRLPDRTTWTMIVGLGSVAGIGFTVSLFIAGLSFPDAQALTDDAKVGILVASVVAALVGVVVLRIATRGGTPAEDPAERP
jgi:NhaA family Na+:H+ antiporter